MISVKDLLNKSRRFDILLHLGFFRNMDDAEFLKRKYFLETGKKLNLDNPKTFNEKLQWLKLNDRKDIYTTMVDKYAVKEYVANKIGKEYIIPVLGVYDKFDDIDFDKLPNQFVIKCTHDSGGLVVIKDKTRMNRRAIRRKINHSLKRNYYYNRREWPYKNVKPRIIIEKYMEDESGYQLKDYKIFCFNGVPKLIMVDSDRFSDHRRNVYDVEWNRVNINLNFPNCDSEFEKPTCLDEMLKISKAVSAEMPFVRVDFYVIYGKIYFGEITFYPGSGLQKISPEKWNDIMGDWIKIDNIKYNMGEK